LSTVAIIIDSGSRDLFVDDDDRQLSGAFDGVNWRPSASEQKV
jgi:hypothetical protein